MGAIYQINAFAKSRDLSLIDIRPACMAPYDFMGVINADDTVTDVGYPPARHHLMSNEPVIILIDEVMEETLDPVQRLLTQIHEQAQAKVLVVLISPRSAGGLPDARTQNYSIIEAEPLDGITAFAEFLRERKTSDVHLKVADFIEKNGFSGATAKQWQFFAVAQNLGLTVAADGLGDRGLAKRVLEWSDTNSSGQE